MGILPQQPRRCRALDPFISEMAFPKSHLSPACLFVSWGYTQIPASLGCFPSPWPLFLPQWEKRTQNLLVSH